MLLEAKWLFIDDFQASMETANPTLPQILEGGPSAASTVASILDEDSQTKETYTSQHCAL